MPRQNRVTPSGAIIATPERGTFIGNRGVLHDEQGHIKRAWRLKRWLVCVLEFRGRYRRVMTPGRWTELFFLDEATALAAGHRPCAECRHKRFLAFCHAWKAANPVGNRETRPTAGEIDDKLHAERMTGDGSQGMYVAALDALPDGVFVMREEWGEGTYLVYGGSLFTWSPGAYTERQACPRGARVRVLTPKSTVGAIRAGYVPDIHPSVGRLE